MCQLGAIRLSTTACSLYDCFSLLVERCRGLLLARDAMACSNSGDMHWVQILPHEASPTAVCSAAITLTTESSERRGDTTSKQLCGQACLAKEQSQRRYRRAIIDGPCVFQVAAGSTLALLQCGTLCTPTLACENRHIVSIDTVRLVCSSNLHFWRPSLGPPWPLEGVWEVGAATSAERYAPSHNVALAIVRMAAIVS